MAQVATTPAGKKTREALLDAGIAVAQKSGLAGVSVNRVVAKAKVAKGTFYVHFADREAFVDELHARFYAEVGEAVSEATEPLPLGADRLMRGAETYLDVCLSNSAIKALLLEARAEGTLTTTMESRHDVFSALAEPSFKAMGWRDPGVAARLFVAMISEIAILEIDSRKRLPGARSTLRRMLESGSS